jgi:siroheme synthase-like protein
MNAHEQASPYHPIFLNIKGRKCVVVGGGQVALRKVNALLKHGANVEVISAAPCQELGKLADMGEVHILSRDYAPGDLVGALIAIAATDNSKTNKEVAREAKERGTLINVVDDPDSSDFIVPSYLSRGDVTIAVSTGGRSPALARKIRVNIEKGFGTEYASLASLVSEVRSELKRRGIKVGSDDWQEVLDLDWLIDMVQAGRTEEVRAVLLTNLEKRGRRES